MSTARGEFEVVAVGPHTPIDTLALACKTIDASTKLMHELMPYPGHPRYHDSAQAIARGLMYSAFALLEGNLGPGNGLRCAQAVAVSFINRAEEQQ